MTTEVKKWPEWRVERKEVELSFSSIDNLISQLEHLRKTCGGDAIICGDEEVYVEILRPETAIELEFRLKQEEGRLKLRRRQYEELKKEFEGK